MPREDDPAEAWMLIHPVLRAVVSQVVDEKGSAKDGSTIRLTAARRKICGPSTVHGSSHIARLFRLV